MRGLRKRETEKFENFFDIIQKEAEKQNCVFFLENGEGNDFETNELEGEDLCGWLIPKEKAKDFEEQWDTDEDLSDWSDFIYYAFWEGSKENPKITFKSF